MKKVLKKFWMALAIFIILLAVFSSVFRSLTPWAKEYKGEVEQHLSLLLGQPVTIQTMETGWYWFQPVLKFHHIALGDDSKHTIHLNKLLVGINLLKSLWTLKLEPGVLYIDDMHLTVREKEDHWTIDGISTDTLDTNEMSPEKSIQALTWLSQQERLIIKHVSAHIYFNDNELVPLDGLNVSVVNNGGHYKLKGSAKLEQTTTTEVQLLGDGYFNPEHITDLEGTFYFSAEHVVPAQWQRFFPKVLDHLEGGAGDIKLWLDLKKGSLASAQSHIQLEHLAWRLGTNKKSQLIQSFFANLSWKPNEAGWQFHADKIKLRVGGLSWPENQLLIKYNKEEESYSFFVKTIIIDSLLSDAGNWPKSIRSFLQIKPQGILEDTQVLIKASTHLFSIPPIRASSVTVHKNKANEKKSEPDVVTQWTQKNEIAYILTRFTQLGWNADSKKNIPEVKNLSGVVNWQPEEGHLELDSEKTKIAFKDYPTQNLSMINAAFDWKELSDGLRISMERFVVSKPDLTLSAQGVVDQVSLKSVGTIRLGAEFSGKNFEQWAKFLPKNKMKPKLYEWLTQDFKRIPDISGRITLNGLAKDFPFDNHNGEFTILSHVSGASLYINSKWKKIREIEGDIQLRNRDLNIDILSADFQGVPVKQLNLRIDAVGKNKEILSINGTIKASIQKMLNYVLASPLKQKLSLLEQLAIKGIGQLDLSVDIPLYPENDTILAKGALSFHHNKILVQQDLAKFTVEGVNGRLFFNESGVSESSLEAEVLGHPLSIKLNSEKTPVPATTITVDGSWTVDSLKSQFDLPVLSLLSGSFPVNAVLKIPNKPTEANSISFNSSLEGLAVKLPAPLGKKHKEQVPLVLHLDLNADKSIALKSNYDGRLSTDFLFKNTNGVLDFDSGQVQLGSADAVQQNLPGLAVVGSLKGFNLNEWKEVYTRFSTEQGKTSLMNKLRIINVTFDKLSFMQQQFDALSIKAKLIGEKDWSFSLSQKNIAGDLVYRSATNEFSGHIERLHLEKIDSAASSSKNMHPNQIPNLNLRVDNLSVGEIHIGDLVLKSQSTPERFSLNYCKVSAPEYQIDLQGEWKQKNTVNTTKLHLTMNMTQLAKSLERWNINPVVDAKKGYVEFKGGWNNTMFNFSRSSLNGDLFLQFKNGVITHLSKETEEKLGLGKLLSILSLQTIPRRLQLDFSDLAHQGYSFDVFQGTFHINKGIMKTEDSYIDGPVAYASMKGSLDLAKRNYDLDLGISPHITASLPIVATIAGGPVAGVATWVATKIINQGMQKITAYSYKISGPWNQPVVQQVSIVKKLNESKKTDEEEKNSVSDEVREH